MEGKTLRLFGKDIVVNERAVQDPFANSMEGQQEKPNTDIIDSGRAVAILNPCHNNLIQAESVPEESHAPNRVQRKTTHWTEDEHKLFLKGLNKHGKGRWTDIAKEFVLTKTPIQVASHAQKYFIHQKATEKKKKRRRSVLDTALNTVPVEISPLVTSIVPQIEISPLVTPTVPQIEISPLVTPTVPQIEISPLVTPQIKPQIETPPQGMKQRETQAIEETHPLLCLLYPIGSILPNTKKLEKLCNLFAKELEETE